MQLPHKPAAILSRQPLRTLDRSRYASASGVAYGAYVLADAPGERPEVMLIASGSELSLAVDAHESLAAEGIRSRVISIPSWEIFEEQPPSYREEVLPAKVAARIAIEQASTFGWERYVGSHGRVIGMKTFGASAPRRELQRSLVSSRTMSLPQPKNCSDDPSATTSDGQSARTEAGSHAMFRRPVVPAT